MKRSPMKRATKPMERARIKRAEINHLKRMRPVEARALRRAWLRPVSKKTRTGRPAFDTEYHKVDARSLGMCELSVFLSPEDGAHVIGTCARRATEHHHTVKPRRAKANHVPARIIHLCADHHARCEGPRATFAQGRLVIVAAGDGTFRARYCYSKSDALAIRASAS